MFYSVDMLRTSAQDTGSQVASGKGGARICGAFAKTNQLIEHQKTAAN